jgi:hypothetical protein
MFKKVKVDLNGIDVTANTNGLYPYACYLTTLLNYSNTSKMAELQAAGWYPDRLGLFNVCAQENTG